MKDILVASSAGFEAIQVGSFHIYQRNKTTGKLFRSQIISRPWIGDPTFDPRRPSPVDSTDDSPRFGYGLAISNGVIACGAWNMGPSKYSSLYFYEVTTIQQFSDGTPVRIFGDPAVGVTNFTTSFVVDSFAMDFLNNGTLIASYGADQIGVYLRKSSGWSLDQVLPFNCPVAGASIRRITVLPNQYITVGYA